MQLRDTWYNTRGIITAIIANPNENWTDMFSLGQLESKFWIVEELEALNALLPSSTAANVNLGTVFICGGWFGSLANMIFTSNVQVDKIRSFDIDPSCLEIAEAMNRDYVIDNWKFKAVTEDMYNINYTGHTYNTPRCTSPFAYDSTLVECHDVPNTIINTSSEHIEDFDAWYNSIPDGKLVILQNNNYFDIEDHISCVKDIEEFREQCPINNLLYGGTIELNEMEGGYNRFMLIGIK